MEPTASPNEAGGGTDSGELLSARKEQQRLQHFLSDKIRLALRGGAALDLVVLSCLVGRVEEALTSKAPSPAPSCSLSVLEVSSPKAPGSARRPPLFSYLTGHLIDGVAPRVAMFT